MFIKENTPTQSKINEQSQLNSALDNFLQKAMKRRNIPEKSSPEKEKFDIKNQNVENDENMNDVIFNYPFDTFAFPKESSSSFDHKLKENMESEHSSKVSKPIRNEGYLYSHRPLFHPLISKKGMENKSPSFYDTSKYKSLYKINSNLSESEKMLVSMYKMKISNTIQFISESSIYNIIQIEEPSQNIINICISLVSLFSKIFNRSIYKQKKTWGNIKNIFSKSSYIIDDLLDFNNNLEKYDLNILNEIIKIKEKYLVGFDIVARNIFSKDHSAKHLLIIINHLYEYSIVIIIRRKKNYFKAKIT